MVREDRKTASQLLHAYLGAVVQNPNVVYVHFPL